MVTIDLTTLSGWDDLEGGTYSVTVGAKSSQYNRIKQSSPVSVTKPIQGYLAFSSSGNFGISTFNHQKNWDGTLEYSTNTTTWNIWDGTDTIWPVNDGNNYKLYVRGNNNTYITGGAANTSCRWEISLASGASYVSCKGNIETLLDYQTVLNEQHPVMADNCFAFLFYMCSNLGTSPNLPAVTLSKYCYRGMFNSCTNLQNVPALPATVLDEGCYLDMFAGCSSLTAVTKLPATVLKPKCYMYMFTRCTGLISLPEDLLPATTLDDSCYLGMFQGCTNLVNVPVLSATTLASECYTNMFYNCTSLTYLPELHALTLYTNCYSYMFYGCSKIKLSRTQTGEYQTPYRIPTTGQGTGGYYELQSMFSNTGGTFTDGTPTINTTYYTSNQIV